MGVTGYQVLRAPGATGGTFAQAGTSTTTSFTNSGLAASTTYRYQVRATDAAGNVSVASNTVTAVTQPGGGTGGACSITPTVQTQWQTGYVIEPARVTNTGTAQINGWTVTARNVSQNGTLAPGANGTFGFQVSRPNGNTQLAGGYACASP